MSAPPELIVKFWPPSITARGVTAINAVRRPLAFAVYARLIVIIIIGIPLVFSGHEYLPWALRLIKFW